MKTILLISLIFVSMAAPIGARAQSRPRLPIRHSILTVQAGVTVKNPAKLTELKSKWNRLAGDCRDLQRAANNQIPLKLKLNRILFELAQTSEITDLLSNDFGVCLDVVPDATGIFANLFAGPRLNVGIIEFPVSFTNKLKTDDEIAFVVAHELAHFVLAHEILYVQVESGEEMNALGIRMEREADELAMRLLINGGYDLDRALVTLKELRKGDSVHPNAAGLECLKAKVLSDLR